MEQEKMKHPKEAAQELFEQLANFAAENNLIAFGTLVIYNTPEETKYDTFLVASSRNHTTRFFYLDLDMIATINGMLNDLFLECIRGSIPMFVSVVKENSITQTSYINKIWGASSHDIVLTEDHFPGHILIANGFSVMPPEKEVEKSRFDEVLLNIELTQDQITKHVNLTKGYQVIPPNEYLEFDANEYSIFDDDDDTE